MLAKFERIFCWLTESRVWLRHVDMSCVCTSSPNKMQRVHRHVTGQALTAQLSHRQRCKSLVQDGLDLLLIRLPDNYGSHGLASTTVSKQR